MPAEHALALSASSEASADAQPGPEILDALHSAGLSVADLAVADPGRNPWDACGSFYCNVGSCRGRAIRFWHDIAVGRRFEFADCGAHTGSELAGFADILAATVANWHDIAQDEADQRDRAAPEPETGRELD